MQRTTFYAQQELTVHGQTIERGEPIAHLECEGGLEPDRALAAIASGKASPNKPAPGSGRAAAETNNPESE